MTQRNYRACLDHVLKWEGGYVDHPRDPGGATNHGITRATLAQHLGRPVTKAEVKALTVETAGEIYRPRYWDKVRGGDLADGFDLVAFDGGVNSGPRRGVRWLQKGLGVTADGVMGPQTQAAANGAGDRVVVIQRACAARMGFLRGLKTWSSFGRGWARRVADTEATAVAMATRSAEVLVDEAAKARKAVRNEVSSAAGTTVTGVGADQAAGLPGWSGWVIAAAVVIIIFPLVMRAIHNARRAAAYRAKAQGISQ